MYVQFEESLIGHKMAQMGDESEDETPDNEEDDGRNFLLSDDGKDIDLRCVFQTLHLAPENPIVYPFKPSINPYLMPLKLIMCCPA